MIGKGTGFRAFLLAAAFASAAQTADAAPKVYRSVYGDNTVFAYEDGKNGRPDEWYIGVRGDFNLATFKNEYRLDPPGVVPHATDSFSMKTQLGFDAAIGYAFAKKWRAELNYWYSGVFSDSDSDMTFDISQQTITLNGIYTIREWATTSIYAGAGLGIGSLDTKWSAPGLFEIGTKTDKTSMGFAANVQIGVEEMITGNLYLGLSYRLGYLTGHTQNIILDGGDTFIVQNNGILNNTFGLGLRYAF